MSKQILQKARAVSLITAVAFVLSVAGPIPLQAAAQKTSFGNAGNGYNAASDISKLLGDQSIADGTKNQQQGESTQNMQQMAMGAMQIAQGLLGLLASAAAAGKGSKSQDRGSGLSDLSDYSSAYKSTVNTAPAPTTASSLDPGTSELGVTADDLRKGDLALGMASIEKNYGIPRDDFLNALKNGVDPKDILANAPKNRPSMDLLNKISDGLAVSRGASGADSARSLASGSGGGSLANPAGGLVQGALSPSANEVAAAGGRPIMPSSTLPEEEDFNNLSLSPEVRAAMAQKAAQLKAERELQEMNSWSIFQLVHSRYRKLETMLYGRVERTNPNPAAVTNGF